MTEIDTERLLLVRNWAQQHVDRYDHWQKSAPVREAMTKAMQLRIGDLTTTVIPGLLAAPEAKVRKSVASLEKTIAAPVETSHGYEEVFFEARERTESLRRWLEELR